MFPNPLLADGVLLETFLAHFQSGTPDTEWIPAVAARGWVVLTNDARLKYNPIERDTIMGSNAAVIILAAGYTHPEMAEMFLSARRLVLEFLRYHEPPFIARLYRNRIKMWLSRDDWTP
ncbi:MAG: hypothetical protein J4G13_13185 [Dehalococcoidia bacterium]|nr:hypothetical protein [Dehalococcoidia bacterium]